MVEYDVMRTAAYYTLGCKVNQYETEKIREEMETFGFRTVPFPGPADVLIINSCTVTCAADAKSRSAVRRAVKLNPDAFIVATGCSAELDPTVFARMNGVDLVVPNADKSQIAERLAARFPGMSKNGRIASRPRQRTRALVKVQDGCDQFCAYCAVPLVRREKTSRRLEDVIEEVRALARFGYREIVLTGIRLGSYRDPGTGDGAAAELPDLLQAVASVEGIERVRLSSIEVWEISDRLIDAMRETRTCRHLHIPLQSGDDGILRAMGRPYSASQYMETVMRVREAIPGIGLTTDLVAGFPGETEEAFRRTYELVERVGFSRLHVFRYSPRPGTRAAEMPQQIDPQTKERRSKELIALGERLSVRFAGSMVGSNVDVLIERRSGSPALPCGLTDNYVEVEIAGPGNLQGRLVRVHIIGQHGSRLIGEWMSDAGAESEKKDRRESLGSASIRA